MTPFSDWNMRSANTNNDTIQQFSDWTFTAENGNWPENCEQNYKVDLLWTKIDLLFLELFSRFG